MLRKRLALHIIVMCGTITAMLFGVLLIARWLPQGEQIAYMANLHAQYDLFLTDLQTNHTLQLTRGQSQNSRYPEWSPDGRYIAYHGNIEQRHGIFIMDMQKWTVHWLDFGLDDDLGAVYDEAMVSWAPDGKRIAFHRGNSDAGYAIYIADVTGENIIRLTEGEWQDLHASWSPDGTKIAYSRHARQSGTGTIHILDVDDAINGVDNVGQPQIVGIFPAWSPDGEALVYVDTNYELYRLDLATGITKQLTFTQQTRQNTMPDWSSDGEWIVFSSNRSTNYMIYRVRRDGTDVEQLSIPITTQYHLQAPDYRP